LAKSIPFNLGVFSLSKLTVIIAFTSEVKHKSSTELPNVTTVADTLLPAGPTLTAWKKTNPFSKKSKTSCKPQKTRKPSYFFYLFGEKTCQGRIYLIKCKS